MNGLPLLRYGLKSTAKSANTNRYATPCKRARNATTNGGDASRVGEVMVHLFSRIWECVFLGDSTDFWSDETITIFLRLPRDIST